MTNRLTRISVKKAADDAGSDDRKPNRRGRRRRLGRDRRSEISPVQAPTSAAAIGRGRLAIVVTIVAWAAYVFPTLWGALTDDGFTVIRLLEAISYTTITTLLALSALVYLWSRRGEMLRNRNHQRTPRAIIDDVRDQTNERSITCLVPAYREDARVIRQSLLSVALQEVPNQRVVLLIDDPPDPDTLESFEMLETSRAQPARIADMLRGPADSFAQAAERFEPSDDQSADALECAAHYAEAARIIRSFRDEYRVDDHTDRFMRDDVLGRLERDFETVGLALAQSADSDAPPAAQRISQLYRRLQSTFTCQLESFERKTFANLSHEANKAMNLNSYIGLMGHHYRHEGTGNRRVLVPCDEATSELEIPASDYLLTLDADSMVLPEYCLRLIHRLEQPGFDDVAVIQTPYSSIPGAATRLERIGGATTDIQYLLHQGMTYYGATFWVGANAILRTSALNDIEQIDDSGRWPVKKYIADRTVIEDTESSIDLVAAGWRLHNYQERLSFSATPPDFGSLCIQRERWANGGLVILGKFLATSFGRGHNRVGLLLRLNYLASIAWGSVALLFLLLWPFSDQLISPLVAAIAAPYFIAMSSDLKRIGFKRTDVVRVYAFNLLMLPINLVGAAKSLYQATTGRKYAFARTPKVKDRTTSKLGFVLFPYLLIGWSAWTAYRDVLEGAIGHAIFAALNAALTTYGLIMFIGVRNSLVDIFVRMTGVFFRDDHSAATVRRPDQRVDWSDVLFYGDSGGDDLSSVRLPPGLATTQPETFLPVEERTPVAASLRSGRSEHDELRLALAHNRRTNELIERRLETLDGDANDALQETDR
jgi:cellulose synthase (UDP-forming)